jgi:tetrahydromethanopterin S-methyltransferase subunit E
MTEAKALFLAIGGLLLVHSGVITVLLKVEAGVEPLALTLLVAMCIGAYASSSIVMHYGAKRREAEREQTKR